MIIIINHKNNLNLNEIKKYERKLRKYKVIVLPTTSYLALFQKGNYILGAQDISGFDNKSITGEVSGKQLKSLNVKYCLIGHNDRIHYLKENKKIISEKANQCVKNNIIPLCSINNEAIDKIKEDIDFYLKELNIKKGYIIYEPISNIGNDNPNMDNLYDNIVFIKNYIKKTYNMNFKIIYGGGVSLNNIDIIRSYRIIDGVIISTNSLDIKNIDKLFYKANN